jgi:hypothetical protein
VSSIHCEEFHDQPVRFSVSRRTFNVHKRLYGVLRNGTDSILYIYIYIYIYLLETDIPTNYVLILFSTSQRTELIRIIKTKPSNVV